MSLRLVRFHLSCFKCFSFWSVEARATMVSLGLRIPFILTICKSLYYFNVVLLSPWQRVVHGINNFKLIFENLVTATLWLRLELLLSLTNCRCLRYHTLLYIEVWGSSAFCSPAMKVLIMYSWPQCGICYCRALNIA